MSDWKVEFVKAILMAGLVAYEWWAMQPYHEPLMAKFWHVLARICYRLARTFGSFGLTAEHQYYLEVA